MGEGGLIKNVWVALASNLIDRDLNVVGVGTTALAAQLAILDALRKVYQELVSPDPVDDFGLGNFIDGFFIGDSILVPLMHLPNYLPIEGEEA